MKSIQELRKQAELTQTELAEKLGIDQSYISRVENGIWPLNDAVMQLRLSEALGVPLTDLVSSSMPVHKLFPMVVHGKITHNAGEFYDALKKNAESCTECKSWLEGITKFALKELAEAVWWTYLMSLDISDRKAVLRSLQDGTDKEKWDKNWQKYGNLYFECLEEDWDNRVPRVLHTYAEWKKTHKKEFEEIQKRGKEGGSSREHVQ